MKPYEKASKGAFGAEQRPFGTRKDLRLGHIEEREVRESIVYPLQPLLVLYL